MSSYTVLESNILNSLYSFEKELFFTNNLELAKKIATHYAKKKYGENIIVENKINLKKMCILRNSIIYYRNSENNNYIYSIVKN